MSFLIGQSRYAISASRAVLVVCSHCCRAGNRTASYVDKLRLRLPLPELLPLH